MIPRKQLNHIPDEAECFTLREVIAQEEAVIDTIRKLQKEHELKHQLLTEKAITLQRALDSTEVLREVGSQLCTHLVPLLAQLQSQLATQETDKPVMTSLFPSTSVFIHSWEVIKDGITVLDAALKRQLDRTQERIPPIAQHLYSTEALRDQMSSSISSFSSMIESAQESIKAKREGILHPIRRLPVEILLHIFEDSVSDEVAQKDHNLPSVFVRSTMALHLASVCSRWRDVMLDAPRLWRHLQAPTWTWRWNRDSGWKWDWVGGSHFKNHLDRCLGGQIELSVRRGGGLPDDLIPADTRTVQRLNLELDEHSNTWPTLPSPVHLWLYHPEPVSGWVIPSALIGRTTHLTVCNVGISFQEDSRSLKRLEICGSQTAPNIAQMLRQLPNLTDLDLLRAEMGNGFALVSGSFTHFHLQYLGLSRCWIDLLESVLSEGLRLPQLRHLELSNITSECIATGYPLISAQLSATVVRLDFRRGGSSLDAIRSFIDAFRRVNTIACCGEVTETVLRALYEVRTFRTQIPGEDTLRYTRKIVHAMPKALEVVIIRNYKGKGRKIDQQLRKMRRDPAVDAQPINVVFENCLNILPRIRREFAVPGPLIVLESVDYDLHAGHSNCGLEDVNDWILDQLEAADG